MKIKKFTPQILTTMLVLIASQLSAQATTSTSGVVSDDVLLWSMVGVIALLIIVNMVLSGTIKSISSDKNIWSIVKEKAGKSNSITPLIITGLLFGNFGAFAQDGSTSPAFIMSSDLFYALLAMVLILLFLLFYQIKVVRELMNLMKGETEECAETESDAWVAALTDTVPIEREEEIMFEHEHDGIRELDNNLPPWWLWGFYATIAFAIWYVPYYHFFGGQLQGEEYSVQMAEAEEAKAAYMAGLSNLIDETNVEAALDDASLAEGKGIYTTNCVACHGANGEGGVGPNFADNNWLHGGGIKNIFKTIKYGVPSKGMIPWEDQMSPGQMKSVASYILTFKGTNPSNQKEAQGDVWVEEGETAPVEQEAVDNEEVMEEVDAEPDLDKQENTND